LRLLAPNVATQIIPTIGMTVSEFTTLYMHVPTVATLAIL
jgi:hypothetical protein